MFAIPILIITIIIYLMFILGSDKKDKIIRKKLIKKLKFKTIVVIYLICQFFSIITYIDEKIQQPMKDRPSIDLLSMFTLPPVITLFAITFFIFPVTGHVREDLLTQEDIKYLNEYKLRKERNKKVKNILK